MIRIGSAAPYANGMPANQLSVMASTSTAGISMCWLPGSPRGRFRQKRSGHGRGFCRMNRPAFALAFALLIFPAFAQAPASSAGTPPAALAKPPADAKVWSITDLAGTHHGQVSLWTASDGTHWSRFTINLRGFMSDIDEQNRFASDGTLQS